jgi:pyruvate dehydrogenase (quinone)
LHSEERNTDMASTKVSDHILQRLREWDVTHVFAYAGDGINGLLAAWGRADNKPKFVQSRHEEMSAFQAVGYAKFSGKVGVCAATSGPGAIHLLNGLYDAKLDHVPVVALVGQTNRSAMGGSYQQEVDLQNLFKDVASDFCETAMVPEQLPNLIDRAMRTAYARRTVTAVIIPADVQELDYSPPKHAFKMVPSSMGIGRYAPVPVDEDVERAAEILNAGEKVAVLVGQGARGARAEVERLADVLGAGVARRPALCHRLDRPARHPAVVRDDAGLRHPADDRIQLPVHPVHARARPGQGRADRHRPAHDRAALPLRGEPRR